MAQKVVLPFDEAPIAWPKVCARCCRAPASGWASASISKNVTRLWEYLIGRRRYEECTIQFPVCDEHAAAARLATWLTRKSPLPTLVRVGGYVFGPFGFLMPPVILMSLWRPGCQHVPWFFVVLAVACSGFLLSTLWAYRRTPVRILDVDGSSLVLRVANDAFAEMLARATAKG